MGEGRASSGMLTFYLLLHGSLRHSEIKRDEKSVRNRTASKVEVWSASCTVL